MEEKDDKIIYPNNNILKYLETDENSKLRREIKTMKRLYFEEKEKNDLNIKTMENILDEFGRELDNATDYNVSEPCGLCGGPCNGNKEEVCKVFINYRDKITGLFVKN